jgi:hypothetical protein
MMKQTIFVLVALLVVGSAVSAAPSKDTVTLCHKAGKKAGATMTVPQPAAGGHFGHGDTAGACQASPSR